MKNHPESSTEGSRVRKYESAKVKNHRVTKSNKHPMGGGNNREWERGNAQA